MELKEGVLILEDGNEFPGFLFGAVVSAESIRTKKNQKDFGYGEVVFNTSMTGYQEILTDPSYFGQIICMTVPHVGNTGINFQDSESSQPWCGGFVVHEYCRDPSHPGSKNNLEDYLITHEIPGISQVDTRALTRHLRSRGVTRALILPRGEKNQAKDLFHELPGFEGRDLIHQVSTKKSYVFKPAPSFQSQTNHSHKISPHFHCRVVAMDFGIKQNMLQMLSSYGCETLVVPAKTSSAEILSQKPDGVFLSNGPGDPTAAPYAIQTIQEILGKVPVFGVCMGHQLLALALGAKTYKLKFGHRGGNQPVLEHETGRVEISSHNHGYAVDSGSLPASVEVTHTNLNDRTVEGLGAKKLNAFSVQYHPEACPGPHDSLMLFDKFIRNIKENVSKIS